MQNVNFYTAIIIFLYNMLLKIEIGQIVWLDKNYVWYEKKGFFLTKIAEYMIQINN